MRCSIGKADGEVVSAWGEEVAEDGIDHIRMDLVHHSTLATHRPHRGS